MCKSIAPSRESFRRALSMRYLYFRPKSFLPNQTKQWTTNPKLQKFTSLLETCSTKTQLVQIHAQLIRTHFISDSFLLGRVISHLCSHCSQPYMAYARKMFDQMLEPNVFTWNAMIRGYTNSNSPHDGLLLYKLMISRGLYPDSYTLSVVTRACAQITALQTGQTVHGTVTKLGFDSDMFVMSGFINLYGNCGRIEDARYVFDEMSERDIVTWTSMMYTYAQLNKWNDIHHLFDEMLKQGSNPNKVTFMNLLSACKDLEKGEWVHSQISKFKFESDLDVSNSLITMYSRCGSVSKAFETFSKMPIKNTISWNALIGGLVQNGQHKEALNYFKILISFSSNPIPDEITLSIALSSCAQLSDINQGKFIHNYINNHEITLDKFLTNSLINMYSKCGDIETAFSIFGKITKKDVVSWTGIICGFINNGHYLEALNLFEQMKNADVAPNQITLVSLLTACSQLGSLERGKEIHNYILEKKIEKDEFLETALVDMYSKTGSIETALEVFNLGNYKNTLAFNAMIGGLANHGRVKEAVVLFNQLEKLGFVKPDKITFKVVLSACVHGGFIKEGIRIFNLISNFNNISLDLQHYGLMVDLFARAGLIDQAIDFVDKMPIKPNHVIWGNLISACRVHRRPSLGRKLARNISNLESNDEGVCVNVSNLYAELGKWDEVGREREEMGKFGIEKLPGFSLIE